MSARPSAAKLRIEVIERDFGALHLAVGHDGEIAAVGLSIGGLLQNLDQYFLRTDDEPFACYAQPLDLAGWIALGGDNSVFHNDLWGEDVDSTIGSWPGNEDHYDDINNIYDVPF